LALDAALGRGDNARTTFGGNAPLKIWEGKKRAKIGAVYDNFRLSAQTFLEPMKIAMKSKRLDESDPFRVKQKNFVKFGPLRKSYRRLF